jgi:FG-GAP repeat
MRRGVVVPVLVTVVALMVCPAVGRSTGAAATMGAVAAAISPGFDGDGIGDLAVGAPGEGVGAAGGAGAVQVLYGANGAMTSTGQTFRQGAGGVPGSSEAGDGFGAAVAQGDFNGDGHFDLAVGAPGEDIGAVAAAGAVTVLYGSDAGLVAAGSQLRTQANAEAGDGLGGSLAANDFDADGYWDLAAGSPGEDVGGRADAGAVSAFAGGPAGLATRAVLFYQGSGLVKGTSEAGDRFGAALGASSSSLPGDLAVGVPGEDVGAVVNAGSVIVLSSLGTLLAEGSNLFTQSQPEAGDGFGSAVSMGDYSHDGFSDLAVGAPGEAVGSRAAAGAVSVLYGSGGGLRHGPKQLFTQDSAGVAGLAEPGDRFGAALASGRYNDWPDDLAVGTPGEDVGQGADAGAVTVLFSAGVGQLLTGSGSQQLTQADPEPRDRFGATLSDPTGLGELNVRYNQGEDLAVGAPGETVGGRAGAGAVSVLFGASDGGLGGDGSQFLFQGGGLGDVAEAGDRVGAAAG